MSRSRSSVSSFSTDSAIVRMTPHPRYEALELSRFEAMMAAAFSQRRKLLRHSLGRWLEEQGFEAGGQPGWYYERQIKQVRD